MNAENGDLIASEPSDGLNLGPRVAAGGEAAWVANVLQQLEVFRERAERNYANAVSESDRADYWVQESHWAEAAVQIRNAAGYN